MFEGTRQLCLLKEYANKRQLITERNCLFRGWCAVIVNARNNFNLPENDVFTVHLILLFTDILLNLVTTGFQEKWNLIKNRYDYGLVIVPELPYEKPFIYEYVDLICSLSSESIQITSLNIFNFFYPNTEEQENDSSVPWLGIKSIRTTNSTILLDFLMIIQTISKVRKTKPLLPWRI